MVESVDTVHTSFLVDRTPRSEDLKRPLHTHCLGRESALPLQIACWMAPLRPRGASSQDEAPISRA